MSESIERVLERVKEDNVRFVNLQFSDIAGKAKSVTISVKQLESSLRQGTWFDGSSIEGFTRICESDMFLMPDPSTYSVLPWYSDENEQVARFICDIYMPDGKPFAGDPRHCLKRVLKEAEDMGYIYNTGPELEFFLFKKNNGKVEPLPHDSGGYFDLILDDAFDIRKDMIRMLEKLGLNVETSHHEVAPGQHEIDFEYGTALMTADRATTMKFTLKALAQNHGLHATFMPKPVFGINGSGMHVHQSLFSPEGKNLFFDENGKYHLSDLARYFIAGQLKYIAEMCVVTNPTVNSYKRLVPGYEAPVYICWGQTNRSALIRIPRYSKGRESATRIELRNPDASNNPYLAFAVMLAAGLEGIKNKWEPPAPVEEDVYGFDDAKLKEMSIGTLPLTLGNAVNLFEKSEFTERALGGHLFSEMISLKKQEWRSYCRHVTKWELNKYLDI